MERNSSRFFLVEAVFGAAVICLDEVSYAVHDRSRIHLQTRGVLCDGGIGRRIEDNQRSNPDRFVFSSGDAPNVQAIGKTEPFEPPVADLSTLVF